MMNRSSIRAAKKAQVKLFGNFGVNTQVISLKKAKEDWKQLAGYAAAPSQSER